MADRQKMFDMLAAMKARQEQEKRDEKARLGRIAQQKRNPLAPVSAAPQQPFASRASGCGPERSLAAGMRPVGPTPAPAPAADQQFRLKSMKEILSSSNGKNDVTKALQALTNYSRQAELSKPERQAIPKPQATTKAPPVAASNHPPHKHSHPPPKPPHGQKRPATSTHSQAARRPPTSRPQSHPQASVAPTRPKPKAKPQPKTATRAPTGTRKPAPKATSRPATTTPRRPPQVSGVKRRQPEPEEPEEEDDFYEEEDDLSDFLDDEQYVENNISSIIRSQMARNYGKPVRNYQDVGDDDCADMEASWRDVMREEAISNRIAKEEDRRELELIKADERREKEQRQRMLAKKQKTNSSAPKLSPYAVRSHP